LISPVKKEKRGEPGDLRKKREGVAADEACLFCKKGRGEGTGDAVKKRKKARHVVCEMGETFWFLARKGND